MKPASVHPEAEAEADGAFEWYWSRSESSALAFDAELREAFSFLRRSPQICAPYLRETRRVMLRRFPYFVVFRELPSEIQIIAVAHAKRRPGYWRGRI
ncbi:MAG: type II toxin-antitoxin system RelE/ParE family toxin [Terracidiphilus sp.]